MPLVGKRICCKRWPRHPACRRRSCKAFSAGGRGRWLLCGFVKKDYAEGLNHVWSGYLVNISITWSQIVVQDWARHCGRWYPSPPRLGPSSSLSQLWERPAARGREALPCQLWFCPVSLWVRRVLVSVCLWCWGQEKAFWGLRASGQGWHTCVFGEWAGWLHVLLCSGLRHEGKVKWLPISYAWRTAWIRDWNSSCVNTQCHSDGVAMYTWIKAWKISPLKWVPCCNYLKKKIHLYLFYGTSM